jgi:hypothetical protein
MKKLSQVDAQRLRAALLAPDVQALSGIPATLEYFARIVDRPVGELLLQCGYIHIGVCSRHANTHIEYVSLTARGRHAIGLMGYGEPESDSLT